MTTIQTDLVGRQIVHVREYTRPERIGTIRTMLWCDGPVGTRKGFIYQIEWPDGSLTDIGAIDGTTYKLLPMMVVTGKVLNEEGFGNGS